MNSNTVKITLQVDDKGTVKIKGAGDALDQMGTKGKAAGKSLEGMNTQTTKGGTELGKFTTASGNANKSLGQMTKGAGLLGTAMKGAMAYFSVKALANLGSDAIGVASSFETLGVSLKTVTGSSAAADKALSWITEFTAKTPYQLDSVADGFRKLTAYGLDATKYLGTLGDTASAMGKSLDGAVEMFADAAQGEFERLKEFGVRASVEGDNVTFKWMENGQQMETTAEKTQTGITTALDGVFAHFKGGMEEQSQTWSGMMSNLEDTTTLFQKKVMDSGPFVVMKSTLSEFVGYLSTVEGQMTMDQWAEDTGHAIVNAMEVATWAVEPLAFAVNGLGGAFDALKLGVAEAEEFLLDMYTSVPTWMLPESMEMSSVTIDALRQTIHQTKEEATADIIETSETIEGLHGKFDSLRGMIDKAGESGSKSIKSIGSEAAATAKTVSGVATSTAKSVTSTATDTAKTLTKTDSSYISDSHSIYKKGLQRRGELLTDWEQDQLDLQDDLVDEFEEMTGDQYEFERKAILKKAKMYEDAGADKVDVAEWAEGEIERINNEEEEDAADLFRKNAIAGDDFFAGLQAGYADNLEYARTWGQTGYDIARDFAQESGDVVGDVLFDAVKGDMASLGDYWESFWDSMLRSMT
ncbi:MAG: tape measure protein, partial [Kiritimatiellia bacterium]